MNPRYAWAFATAFLCLLLPARVGVAVSLGNGVAGAAVTVALFVLPLLYTVPRGRVWWDRYPGRLLTVQAVLTYVPFVMFGQTWAVGLSGLLAGLLLLTVPGRRAWLLFAAIVAVEGVLRLGVLGVYPVGGAQFVSWVFVVPVDMALPLFGLVRLSDLVAELGAARIDRVRFAVMQERLRASARLRAAIGGRLETVTARAGAAVAVLPDSVDRARAFLAEAAGIARQAVEQVRETVVEDERAEDERVEDERVRVERDGLRPALRRAGGTVAPRLALLVLVADLAAFAGHHVVVVVDELEGGPAVAGGVAAIVVIAALQLYHSLAGRAGSRPRGWRVTLTVQVLLPFVAIAATIDERDTSLTGMVGFSAGSVLLLLRGRRAWAVFAVVSVSVGAPWVLLHPREADSAAYLVGVVASTGLAVYGLSRLTNLAEELEAARRELARAAVARERLRVARDTHDLLGLGLSAVALKCDLAGRLIGRDDSRARAELDALVRLAARARADVQAVTSGEHGLSLDTELAAARDILTSAGIDVAVRTVRVPLEAQVDAALATVLREAVTNVLRHATATRCEIDLTADNDTVTLRVGNNGVPAEPRGRAGRGLANLAARATALGGHLTTDATDGRFTLTAQTPRLGGG